MLARFYFVSDELLIRTNLDGVTLMWQVDAKPTTRIISRIVQPKENETLTLQQSWRQNRFPPSFFRSLHKPEQCYNITRCYNVKLDSISHSTFQGSRLWYRGKPNVGKARAFSQGHLPSHHTALGSLRSLFFPSLVKTRDSICSSVTKTPTISWGDMKIT